jgi:hypothetical protein
LLLWPVQESEIECKKLITTTLGIQIPDIRIPDKSMSGNQMAIGTKTGQIVRFSNVLVFKNRTSDFSTRLDCFKQKNIFMTLLCTKQSSLGTIQKPDKLVRFLNG